MDAVSDLTRRQRAIFEFVVGRIQGEGIPPTLMEIADAFGLSSPAGISDHLKAIERKGYIRRRPGASRGIELAVRSGRRPTRRSVRAPILGRVPSARGLQASAGNHVLFDGRIASGEVFALRASVRGLERRGILEGDLLIVERAPARRKEMFVARQDDSVLLLELAEEGRTARPVAGRPDLSRELEFEGRVIAILRVFEAWQTQ